MHLTPRSKLAVLFTFLSVVWASEFVAVKVGLSASPPLIFAGLRYLLAGAALLLPMIVRGYRPRNSRELLVPILLGVFATLEFGFLHYGMQYLSGGTASILFNTQPIMVAALAVFVLKESFTWKKAVANLGGFLGVVLIFAELPVGLAGFGGVLVLFAAFSYAIFTIMFKKLIKTENLLFISAVILLTCSVFLLIASAFVPTTFSLVITPQLILIIFYLAIVSSALGFIIYFHLLKTYDVTQVSPYQFLIPVFAVFLGWLFLGETVHFTELMGILCVALGIYVLNK